MQQPISHEHARKVDDLLSRTRANNGLAPVDFERFWEDQADAAANPFGRSTISRACGCGRLAHSRVQTETDNAGPESI